MNDESKHGTLTLPNLLTFSRIAVIPIIMALLMVQGPTKPYDFNRQMSLIAASLFLLAGLTDLLDGYFARKWNQVSIMGKFSDPIADKLIHMVVMVVFIPMGRIAAWWVVLFLFREIMISGLRAVAAAEDIIIDAGSGGKKKTFFLNCGLTAWIIWDPLFGLNAYSIGMVFMILATIFAFSSAFQYTRTFFTQYEKRHAKSKT